MWILTLPSALSGKYHFYLSLEFSFDVRCCDTVCRLFDHRCKNHKPQICFHWKTGIEGWIIFKPTIRKCDRARNWTWDLSIARGMLWHLSYLVTITWQVLFRIILVDFSTICILSDLKDEREKFPLNQGKLYKINWKFRQNMFSCI